jgi:phosphate transport system substrate-binding protein
LPRLSRRLWWTFAAALLFTLLVFATELALEVPGAIGQDRLTLVATGSSLPEPLYVGWADEYRKVNPAVIVRYLPQGTGESGQSILAGSGDLGGGDAPIPDKQLRADDPILQLPTVLIGIVIVYNLPESPGDLRLTGPVVAEIFLGKIKTWNDPAIAKLNPDMKLPAQPIQVVHRTEGKGSNYILADYLCKVSPDFLAKAGRGESPKWPVGTSAARSADMSDHIRTTPFSIGYAELNLAERASLRAARIKNSANEFVKPTQKTIANAALEAKISDDFRVSLTNAPAKTAIPSRASRGYTFRRKPRIHHAAAPSLLTSNGSTPTAKWSPRIRATQRCPASC